MISVIRRRHGVGNHRPERKALRCCLFQDKWIWEFVSCFFFFFFMKSCFVYAVMMICHRSVSDSITVEYTDELGRVCLFFFLSRTLGVCSCIDSRGYYLNLMQFYPVNRKSISMKVNIYSQTYYEGLSLQSVVCYYVHLFCIICILRWAADSDQMEAFISVNEKSSLLLPSLYRTSN